MLICCTMRDSRFDLQKRSSILAACVKLSLLYVKALSARRPGDSSFLEGWTRARSAAGNAGSRDRVSPAGRSSALSGTRAPSLRCSACRGCGRPESNGPGGGGAQWPSCCSCQHALRGGRLDLARRQCCGRCGGCSRHGRGFRTTKMPPTGEPPDVLVAPARLAARTCAGRLRNLHPETRLQVER